MPGRVGRPLGRRDGVDAEPGPRMGRNHVWGVAKR